MKKLLVIGSNSFSGANFINMTLTKGYEVYGVSRSQQLNKVMLPYLKNNNASKFRFSQICLNQDFDKLKLIIKEEKFEFIVNFAAQSMVGQSWDIPEDWMNTNVVSISKLANFLREQKSLKKYIHVTTPEVYGSTNGWVKENYNYNPSTPYAVSRAASDMIFRIYSKEFSLPVVFTRAANVFGPGQQLYRIIPISIYNILTGNKIKLDGGGQSTRSFIYMDDVSEATLLLLENGSSGETYHISTKKIISIRELVEIICDNLSVRFDEFVEVSDERVGKDNTYQLDSSKIRKEIEWKEKTDLEKGIQKTISWIKENLDDLKKIEHKYIHKP